MKKTINLLALFVLVSVNAFTPFSYAQLDDLQVSVPETVDQNVLPEINDGLDLDNENQNINEIIDDKVGETTKFDDYSWWEESEKEDDEKTWVENIPEVSDNIWWLFIDIVVDGMDEYSEVEEPKVEEPEIEESVAENVVSNINLLNLVKESVLLVNDSQIVKDLELYFLRREGEVKHYSIMDRNLGASEVYNQDWNNQNEESYGYYYKWWNNQWFTASDSDFLSASIWTRAEWEQWPCPDGYYIPNEHDWSLIKNDWSAYANRSSRTGFAYDLLLPPAGIREIAGVSQVGGVWTYRTSSPYSNTWAYALFFITDLDGFNTPIPNRSRSIGASLRCFKNDFQSVWSLKFHLNWWQKGVIAVNDGKFTSMSSPYRLVSIFEGWYTTPDFQPWTKLWVWSGAGGVTDLYAKWWCFEWYVLSGNACVGWTIVTFDTYWWASQSWSITVPYWTVLDLSWKVANLPDWTIVEITWEAIAYSWQTFAWWGTGYDNYRTIKTLVIPDGMSSITLHAIFRGDFTIEFNATENWWETDTGSISVPYGTLINLSEYTATKGSWWVRTFLWRNTDPDATWGFSDIYKAENEDSNQTILYAIFRKDKFNVNFETNGHGDTPSSQTINRWDNIVNPWDLTTPWYTFEWWSDNEYLTTSFDFWTSPTDDVTLYAKWRVSWAECYEWFEYDNDLWMCIKKNEWVVRVWLGWGIILSSWYSDFLENLVTLLITWDYKSKMWNFDIAKNYYWVMLADNDDVLNVYRNDSLDTAWQIATVFEGSRDEWNLLFTMTTKASCRWDEPNCKFYNQNIEVAEWIPEWYNLKLFISEDLKEDLGRYLTWIIRADNIRLIFDPRVVVTFDSNWHWVSPKRQILGKWSRIINPWSLSAVWYKFLGWSDDEYLTSIFDFNAVVNRDIKLYAKWKSIWDMYNCPDWQEYDNSVGLCKRPTDWVIRIWYNWDMEFSSWYSVFLDEVLLKDLVLENESEVEAFKKAFWILMAVTETFDWTDEIVIDEAGVVEDGDLWLLNYYSKDWKLLFTVVVDMTWTESNSSWWSISLIIHTRSTYVKLARDVSSLDNVKLVPSTGINQYVEAYPPIEQLGNLWIVFSDRREPNVVDNWWKHYSWWWWRNKSDTNEEHFSAESQDNSTDADTNNSSQQQTHTDEFQQAYDFARKNNITTMNTIEDAKMNGYMTRIEMAKMLSQYAINILHQTPDLSKWMVNFKDVTDKMDKEYDDAVTLAYELWIMGINMPNNKFRPNDYVTRAEFATALSRMLYGTEDWRPNYYSTHIEKLKSEWIMTILNLNMLEVRWYVMIMLIRASNN